MTKSHAEMTKEKRKTFLKTVSEVHPDTEAYKSFYNFKVAPLSGSSARPSPRQSACDLSDLSVLSGHFSKGEQASPLEKAQTLLYRFSMIACCLWIVEDHLLAGFSAL